MGERAGGRRMMAFGTSQELPEPSKGSYRRRWLQGWINGWHDEGSESRWGNGHGNTPILAPTGEPQVGNTGDCGCPLGKVDLVMASDGRLMYLEEVLQ